jgi:hypothetical protein
MSGTISDETLPKAIDSSSPWIKAVSYTQPHVFNRSNHGARLMSQLSLYRRHEYLCDVIFICQDESSPRRLSAHRLIMSSLSDYFLSLFAIHRQLEVTINDIDGNILAKLIDYAYNGRTTMFNSTNIMFMFEQMS